jgi:hypothetical protein
MQRIKWPAVEADIRRVAIDFQEALAAIMTRLAQALQLPKEELIRVSTVWLDVIRDRRRHHLAPAKTKPAKGMVTQLMLAQPLPVPRTVQVLPDDRHS